MRLLLTTLLVLALSLANAAGDTTTSKYPKHMFEISGAPSADYYFYVKGSQAAAPEPYKDSYPWAGGSVGAQYIFRPIEAFGLSTGLEHRVQGLYNNVKIPGGIPYKRIRTYTHTGYLTVPFQLHGFVKVAVSCFAISTGPEFNFPMYQHTRVVKTTNVDKVEKSFDKTAFRGSNITDNASLGWVISIGGMRTFSKHLSFYGGVDFRFMNITYFNADINKVRNNIGGNINSSLGVKLALRLH